jgi:hypothetical protein
MLSGSRLHWQSLAPTNPHWVCVVGYGPFFLFVIHKEGLCSSSGDINRLIMMMNPFQGFANFYLKVMVSLDSISLEVKW